MSRRLSVLSVSVAAGFSVGGPDEESRESELAVSGRGTPLLLPANIKHVSEQETVTSCCKKVPTAAITVAC